MASVFPKRGKLWMRLKDRKGWRSQPTTFHIGEEIDALAFAKSRQVEIDASTEHRPRGTSDDLYVILSSCGAVKIGRASDCARRMQSIQCTCPPSVMLTVIGIAKGMGSYESTMHEAFKEHRLRGEWFSSVLGDRLRDDLKRTSLTMLVRGLQLEIRSAA